MKLFYLSLVSFVFIATTALALAGESIPYRPPEANDKRTFTPLPVLQEEATFPIVSARAALAVDLGSGVTLYEKEPDRAFLPASTTKIITALVAMGYYPQDAVLRVGQTKVEGQKMRLLPGEEIGVDNLLYGLLMFSANDAAEVLAQNFPGGRESFISAMNAKARELSLENSSFINPSGLDGEDQFTTARDLIRLSRIAMKNPLFSQIVGTKEKVVESYDGKIKHKLVNINQLVGEVEGVLGVKTGWTQDARENLVTYIKRDGRRVMIVLLASQDRFGETRELIDWIFENYEWREVAYPQK